MRSVTAIIIFLVFCGCNFENKKSSSAKDSNREKTDDKKELLFNGSDTFSLQIADIGNPICLPTNDGGVFVVSDYLNPDVLSSFLHLNMNGSFNPNFNDGKILRTGMSSVRLAMTADLKDFKIIAAGYDKADKELRFKIFNKNGSDFKGFMPPNLASDLDFPEKDSTFTRSGFVVRASLQEIVLFFILENGRKLVKYNTSGSLIPFGSKKYLRFDDYYMVKPLADKRLVLISLDKLQILDEMGEPDPSFGNNGTREILDSNQKTIVDLGSTKQGIFLISNGGTSTDDSYIYKFLQKGTLDAKFGTNGILKIEDFWATAVHFEDESIQIAGWDKDQNGKSRTFGLRSLDTNLGSIKASAVNMPFGDEGDYVTDVFRHDNGQVVLCGYSYSSKNGVELLFKTSE